jgi:hypothetical protein
MAEEPFQWLVERFDDVSVLRYQVPGWEKLTLQQKKLAYYLAEAGYSGRDIVYHQVQSAVRGTGTAARFFSLSFVAAPPIRDGHSQGAGGHTDGQRRQDGSRVRGAAAVC